MIFFFSSKNPNVGNGQKQRVPVDVIVQADDRNIPKWVKVTYFSYFKLSASLEENKSSPTV